jgi:hypothetical protein
MALPRKKITREQVLAVIEHIEDGETEAEACRMVGIPNSSFRMAALREEVSVEYARALAALAGDQANKLEEVVRDMRDGKVDWQVARVEIDARKWFASKFLPRRYGDRVDVTTNGKDLPTPILGYVQRNDSNSKDHGDEEPNQGSAGGNLGEQDGIGAFMPD